MEKTVFGTVLRRARLKGSSIDVITYIVLKKTVYGTLKRGARLKGKKANPSTIFSIIVIVD